MPTYVTLVNWTDQGIRNVKDSPKRAEAFEKLQAGPHRLNADQITALIAAGGAPGAGGRGGRGGG